MMSHVGTDDGDKGFAEISFVNAASTEQTSVRCADIPLFDGIGSHFGNYTQFSFIADTPVSYPDPALILLECVPL